jgi:uncharacterized protein YneF (UPF0154 family)
VSAQDVQDFWILIAGALVNGIVIGFWLEQKLQAAERKSARPLTAEDLPAMYDAVGREIDRLVEEIDDPSGVPSWSTAEPRDIPPYNSPLGRMLKQVLDENPRIRVRQAITVAWRALQERRKW